MRDHKLFDLKRMNDSLLESFQSYYNWRYRQPIIRLESNIAWLVNQVALVEEYVAATEGHRRMWTRD